MNGRPKTTGRFRTRAELVDRVRHLYHETPMSVSSVASHCEISPVTAHTILNTREWDRLDVADYLFADPADDGATGVLRHDEEPFEVETNLNQLSCGSGYNFGLYKLNIPDRIKRDLDLI